MDVVLTIIEYIGIIAFALSGAMVAIDKEADLFGVLLMAIFTSFGGGILRDVLLGITPPKFFTELGVMVLVSAASALAVFIFAAAMKRYYIKERRHMSAFINLFDALGLGIFAVSGTSLAIDTVGMNPYIAITMGLITGVFGGLVRDLCLGTVPFIIKKRVYAVAAILGSAVYYFLYVYSSMHIVSVIFISVLTTFGLRLLATVFRWNIPRAITFSEIESEDKSESEKTERENASVGK